MRSLILNSIILLTAFGAVTAAANNWTSGGNLMKELSQVTMGYDRLEGDTGSAGDYGSCEIRTLTNSESMSLSIKTDTLQVTVLIQKQDEVIKTSEGNSGWRIDTYITPDYRITVTTFADLASFDLEIVVNEKIAKCSFVE